jgi:N,N-dimethylformamidase
MTPELTGYADQWSVQPGQRVRFMVSTDLPGYEATIVRLIQADENPAGPGYKEEPVDASVNRAYDGRKQIAHPGSFILVSDHAALRQLSSLTIQMWIYPTTPHKAEAQGLITKWAAADSRGFGLGIGKAGDLEFWIGDEAGGMERVGTGQSLRAKQWYCVAAAYDADRGSIFLYQKPISNWALETSASVVERRIHVQGPAHSDAPLLMASAYGETVAPQGLVGHGLYNGKLDSPRIFGRALTPSEIERLAQGHAPHAVAGEALVAAWDFANNFAASKVLDAGPHGLHGATVNMPARAMTGHNWSSSEFDFRHAPAEYGAIYFHEDDLEDAHWEADFEWTIPDTLRSGFYAARLTAGDQEDHLPFFVRPRRGTATAPIAFLAPTLTYLAYANDRMETLPRHQPGISDRPIGPGVLDHFLAEHPEFVRSLYDHHQDGMRCIYSSWLRPIIGLRPKYRFWLTGAPRHFSADLYLIDWLEAKRLPYDVITDHDLHAEGQDLLARYRVVITGSHPEYWTAPMMTAAQDYLGAGGRLMYLGGNGMYWVTGIDPERPHVIEVRRGVAGLQPQEGAPGEGHLSTTGEAGALWRGRGLAPNRLAGIGFTAQGWAGRAPGYIRQPGSFDPRAAFIFEGVGPEEIIGDFGLVLGGAAGDELDRVDFDLGTPPHTLLLASSRGHNQAITPVLEDVPEISASIFAANNPNVRADMVFFETPQGGAVFSVGSICWFGSLSHKRYNNNVSRITENVVRRFMS